MKVMAATQTGPDAAAWNERCNASGAIYVLWCSVITGKALIQGILVGLSWSAPRANYSGKKICKKKLRAMKLPV
jgi:hypothetical protein